MNVTNVTLIMMLDKKSIPDGYVVKEAMAVLELKLPANHNGSTGEGPITTLEVTGRVVIDHEYLTREYEIDLFDEPSHDAQPFQGPQLQNARIINTTRLGEKIVSRIFSPLNLPGVLNGSGKVELDVRVSLTVNTVIGTITTDVPDIKLVSHSGLSESEYAHIHGLLFHKDVVTRMRCEIVGKLSGTPLRNRGVIDMPTLYHALPDKLPPYQMTKSRVDKRAKYKLPKGCR